MVRFCYKFWVFLLVVCVLSRFVKSADLHICVRNPNWILIQRSPHISANSFVENGEISELSSANPHLIQWCTTYFWHINQILANWSALQLSGPGFDPAAHGILALPLESDALQPLLHEQRINLDLHDLRGIDMQEI